MMDIVKAVIKAHEDGYRYFGIRVMPSECAPLNVGDDIPDSYNWDHELDCSTYETTKETLSGACTIGINTSSLWWDNTDEDNADLADEISKALQQSKKAGYWGNQIVLAGGKYDYEWGEDEGELIISDAQAIAIF